MTLEQYIRERGLTVRLVGQKCGVRRQTLYQYGKKYRPTVKTCEKIAQAMTELGAKTEPIDIIQLYI